MPKRLGVNPRRIFVKSELRKRIRTACNSCNIRRVKCSGNQPCDACVAAHRMCDYPSTDKKVFVGKGEYEDLKASKGLLDKCLAEFLPDPEQRQSYITQALYGTSASPAGAQPSKDDEVHSGSPTASVSTSALSPPYEAAQHHHQHRAHLPRLEAINTGATEGSLLQDRDGTKRWLGGTSGATFLDHLKRFMHTLKSSLGYCGTNADASPGLKFLASRGQYQTSDSLLLFTPPVDPIDATLSLKNWNIAGSLLAKADEYLQSCANNWSCGGVYYFGDLSLQAWLTVQRDETRRREVAFYQAALALGTIYSLTAATSKRDGQLGETFFAKARNILGDPVNISLYTFRDVPALTMMAMYMAEMNRRDNAYIYLSYAITICCMFGGMKGSFTDERDKRIVWTLFCLHKEYACLMGRPPLYSDEAFQLPLPEATPNLPVPSGLLAHIELSKITGYLVSNTYSIAPRQAADRFQNPFLNALHMLEEWRERLHPDLLIPLEVQPEFQSQLLTEDFPADVRKTFNKNNTLPTDRALCMLHMKWNQMLILTLRPLFFLAVKSSIGGDFINEPRDMLDHPNISYIRQCSTAARRNLLLGHHLYKRCGQEQEYGGHGKLVMIDLHHIFNAAVVLLLHQMVFANVVNTDTIAIQEARQIFEREAHTESGSPAPTAGFNMGTGYASDCVNVLNDLAALVARIRPLRFKGSDHIETGADSVWSPLTSADLSSVNGGGSDGAYSTYNMSSPTILSEEQLAANLSLENPFGLDGMYNHDLIHGPPPHPYHTNLKELERWVQEGLWGLNIPLGGYTGI